MALGIKNHSESVASDHLHVTNPMSKSQTAQISFVAAELLQITDYMPDMKSHKEKVTMNAPGTCLAYPCMCEFLNFLMAAQANWGAHTYMSACHPPPHPINVCMNILARMNLTR